MALHVAIRRNCPPEIAFKYIDNLAWLERKRSPNFDWIEKDVKDVLKFREEGLSWSEIGSYYGTTASGVCHAVITRRKNKVDKKIVRAKRS
ncbi:hypothetical protein [Clostridium pasteurianum]|nr:hypothetical protein [Clostridium pasteurianum]